MMTLHTATKILNADLFCEDVALVTSRVQIKYFVENNDLSNIEYDFLKGWDENFGVYVWFTDDYRIVRRMIMLRKKTVDVLLHELSHAITSIMEYRHLVCDETRSYMLQHLFEQACPKVACLKI